MNRAVYNISDLTEEIRKGYCPNYLFFWGHKSGTEAEVGNECLSQWWYAPFEATGCVYPTAEHFMMAEKARLFGDEAAVKKILAAPHPAAAKKAGRGVKNFDEKIWIQHRFEIVVCGNTAKFSRNDNLKRFLLKTGDRVLVEASPVDGIWGIGLAADHPDAANPQKWKGLNLLGFALMKVREQF